MHELNTHVGYPLYIGPTNIICLRTILHWQCFTDIHPSLHDYKYVCFQRRDDDVPIILRKSLPEIGAIFEAQMEQVAQGSLPEN